MRCMVYLPSSEEGGVIVVAHRAPDYVHLQMSNWSNFKLVKHLGIASSRRARWTPRFLDTHAGLLGGGIPFN